MRALLSRFLADERGATALEYGLIIALNIPNGIPLVYELDDELKPLRHYYLGDADTAEKALAAVAAQGKA